MTLGEPVWVKLDSDELPMMDDAGITYTMVDLKASTNIQIVSMAKAYSNETFCQNKSALDTVIRRESHNVGEEWADGMRKLAAATQARLGWVPKERKLGRDAAVVYDEVSDWKDLFKATNQKPSGPAAKDEFIRFMQIALKSGRITTHAMHKMADQSAQADAAITKLAAMMEREGRLDRANDSYDFTGMTIADLQKEGILPITYRNAFEDDPADTVRKYMEGIMRGERPDAWHNREYKFKVEGEFPDKPPK